MNIVLLGPPGSGKGTQAKLIKNKYDFVHISTGDLFRDIGKKKNFSLTKKINRYVKSGLLVPDKIVIKVLKSKINKIKPKTGILFDGFPRNIIQAKELDKYLKEINSQIDTVIFLKVKRTNSIKRLTARRICPKCQRNYNLITDRPKFDEICDICKVKLTCRADDTLPVVNNRLKVYTSETKPVIDYYRTENKLIEIPADDSIEKVFKRINRIIKNAKRRIYRT